MPMHPLFLHPWLLAQSLLLACLTIWLPPMRANQWSRTAALIVAVLAQVQWSNGLSAAIALRGLWGDPSITTLQLLVIAFLGRSPASLARGVLAPALFAGAAAFFYLHSLGSGPLDLYTLGDTTGRPVLIASGALVVLMLWERGHAFWLWLFAIDLIAFAAHVPESANLWDSLLDPLLAFACLFLALRNGWRLMKKKHD